MSMKSSTTRYRPGLHVHVYFWVALVTVSVVLPFVVSSQLVDAGHVIRALSAFMIITIALQALLWPGPLVAGSPAMLYGVIRGMGRLALRYR
jgi:hypothetical protein